MQQFTDKHDHWKAGNKEAGDGLDRINNVNSSMLSFNDDYTNLMSVLSNNEKGDSKQAAMGVTSSTSNTRQRDSDNMYGGNNRAAEQNKADRRNLELLLQHYQELLGKGGSGSGGLGDTPRRKPAEASVADNEVESMVASKTCAHCRRRKMKCLLVPGLPNCIQCETKGIKCTPSALSSPKVSSMVTDDQGKRSLAEDGVISSHDMLKRVRLQSLPNQFASSSNYPSLLGGPNTSSSRDMTAASTSSYKSGEVYSANRQRDESSCSSSSFTSNQNSSRLPGASSSMPKNPVQHFAHCPRSSFYIGPSSALDSNFFDHLRMDRIDQLQLSSTVALRRVSPKVQFILRADVDRNNFLRNEAMVDKVEALVHPHGKILVDIFFKLIHPNFPILHEAVFLEKYSRSHRELNAPILACVYSLAIRWWDFHPQLVGFSKPDVIDKLNEIALNCFHENLAYPKLSIVQAGLLILHCRSELPNNWVICSEVVALAEELGLAIDCEDWKLPRWEKGLRRRLAWAVWYHDKWASMIEGRHSHLILGRNWLIPLVSDDDFPSTSQVIKDSARNNSMDYGNDHDDVLFDQISVLGVDPTEEDFHNGKLLFKHIVALSIILGEILDTFYTLGAINTTTNIEQVLQLAKPLQLKLRKWYDTLPPNLSMNNFHPRRFNNNASLTLAYFAAEITLHRKIVSTLKSDDPEELVNVCRSAAKTRLIAAIEFVRDLKNEHINAFWFTCSSGNLILISSFATLLYLTSSSKEEAKVYKDCLRNYVWILRMASKTFDKAATALLRIQQVLSNVPELLTDASVQQRYCNSGMQSPAQHHHTNSPRSARSASTYSPNDSNSGSASASILNSSSLQNLKTMAPDVLDSLSSARSGNISNEYGSNSSNAPKLEKTSPPLPKSSKEHSRMTKLNHIEDRSISATSPSRKSAKLSPDTSSQAVSNMSSVTAPSTASFENSARYKVPSPGKPHSPRNLENINSPLISGVAGESNDNTSPHETESSKSSTLVPVDKKQNTNSIGTENSVSPNYCASSNERTNQ
ncbi:HDR176Wp [Eremothecium sinecaudum]|uniref:HDR176Wp n=1 Tax=Eremothecium sinecaudum TaxID=45286 RepID=A0A0X8HT45_9SACH|nr:HDR176Wp [Eremothecium sinecaudum]AMD20918.1 HDR176Wp [Eremothecium sinecaudum]